MSGVPRESFVEAAYRSRAYDDEALPIELGQTISQPFMVARMTELLATRPGDRILEIGAGSGYQAAVLAAMGCAVTTIERHPDIAASARERLATLGFGAGIDVIAADGSLGWPDGAPWDGILVAAAAPVVQNELCEQLADGARLVIPVGPRDRQILTVVTRHGNEWTHVPDGACVFVPLVGPGGFEA
jgi:protein-L-isoaspartate(D-aspartate) O-methyltransferase